MGTLISSTQGLLFVILLMVAFSLWLQKYKVCKSLGPHRFWSCICYNDDRTENFPGCFLESRKTSYGNDSFYLSGTVEAG